MCNFFRVFFGLYLVWGIVLFCRPLLIGYAYSDIATSKIHPYYGNEAVLNKQAQQGRLKAYLNGLLKSGRIIRNPNEHKVVLQCDQGSDCYRPIKLSYKEARTLLFGDIHLQKNKKGQWFIRDLYCQKAFTKKDFPDNKSIGPRKIPLHTVLNTEHVWPRSRFYKNLILSKKKRKQLDKLNAWKDADLHILYPSESKTNEQRGNLEFASIDRKQKSTRCFGNNIGTTKKDLHQKNYFEVIPESKGNVARSLFYFSVRYDVPIHPVEEVFLRQWHREDPVDDFERFRNEKIFSFQKVRNPFIDRPGLVDKIEDF
jgi:endonuclease I